MPDIIAALIGNTALELTKRYTKATEAIMIAFAARHGIDISRFMEIRNPGDQKPTLVPVARRGMLLRTMELVNATVGPGIQPGKKIIIQESWCVDRRNGYEGFEKTFPRVQLIHDGEHSFQIKIIDEGTDGTD